MKISSRILFINIAFISVIFVLSGLAVFQLYTLDEIYKDSKTISAALADQMLGDMMHDGLRADVLFAIKLARENDFAGRQEALDSTKEHVETFQTAIQEVADMNVSPKVNETLEALKKPLEQYTQSALKLTAAAFSNPQATQAGYDSFQDDFEYLEGAMEEFSGVIEAEFDTVNASVKAKEELITLLIGASVILALLIALISWLSMQGKIVKPINSMTDTMLLLADGKLDTEIPHSGKKDEIGKMASALQVFKDNALETERMREEQKLREEKAEVEKRTAMKEMADSFEQEIGSVIKTLSQAASEMEAAAGSMAGNADKTNDKAVMVSSAATEASSNVNAVASATEELSASIREISSQVSRSSQVVSEARGKANDTSERVQGLVSSAEKIGEVITLISTIAEQTNLLALNATIEAARAGEAGKGFAVVASEVKTLATETAKATEEISNQIAGIQSATRESGEAIQEILEIIKNIDEISASVSAAVEEQGAATNEIARNVQEASQGTSNVSNNISEVTRAASETGESAGMVLDSAQQLAQQSGVLSQAVGNFLTRVRA